MHKYLQISDQEKIHYLEFGSGESLILLPSLCLTSFSYASFGEKLGNNFHVLIPDLYRGHSIYTQNAYQLEDYVEKLNQFMEKLNIPKVHLIGISLSGIYGSKFAIIYPHKLSKFFLISTTCVPLRMKNLRIKLFGAFLKLIWLNLWLKSGLQILKLWSKDAGKYIFRHPKQFLNEILIATRYDTFTKKKLSISTKLLFATHDEFIPWETYKRMQKVKNLEIELIDDHHAWFFYRQDELVGKIYDFFK